MVSDEPEMSLDLMTLALGTLVLGGASAAAWHLKGRMDSSGGLEVVGFALTLMVANVMQLVAIVVILSLFGD